MQQRTDNFPPYRSNTAEPLHTRAPDQVEQQRLGVVLPVVGCGDPDCVQLPGGISQEFVPHPPGCVLQAEALPPGQVPDVPRPGGQRDAALRAPVPDESLVPVCCGAQMVVEVGRRYLEALLLRQPGEEVKQGHGVPSAGHGAQKKSPCRQHIPPPAEMQDLARQTVIPHRHSASPAC